MPVDSSPYNYRKAVLHEMAAPSSVAAIPDVTDATASHAAAVGSAAAQAAALKADVAYGENRLAQKLDLDRRMLDTWGQNNKWATAIATANLGIQAMGIPAAQKTLERQQAHENTMQNIALRNVAAVENANRTEAARLSSFNEAEGLRKIYGGEEPAIEAGAVVPTGWTPPAVSLRDIGPRRPVSGLPLNYVH